MQDRALEHLDILKYMLDAFEEENMAADAQTLSDNLVTMLFAGYDTSSITLTYAFYLMARHPDVAARCRQEVVSVLGAAAPATYDDVQTKLPLCSAVINETLRLYPLLPSQCATRRRPLSCSQASLSPRAPCSICPFGGSTARPTTSKTPTLFVPRGFSGPSASACTATLLSRSAVARETAWAGGSP